MMMIKATKDYEAGLPPNPALIAGMGKLAAEMEKSGVMLASGGLLPSSQGARIKYSGGKRTAIDGPFTEAKELIGGYAILLAKSKEEAIALANRCVDVHIDAGIAEFEMEIRPMFDPPGCEPAKG
jgi:hypothetical protein